MVMPKLKNTLVPYFFLKEEIEEKKNAEKSLKNSGKVENNARQEKVVEVKEEVCDKNIRNDEWVDDPDVPPLE